MYLDKLKTSKKVDFAKAIKTYVSKHYDINAFNAIESFINELEFARNSAISIADLERTPDNYLKAKTLILNYLQLLTSLKLRLTFGKDNMSVAVQFSWLDVLKKDNYSSYTYYHEYYNMLFNLAIVLFNLGKLINLNDSDDVIKAGIKNFNYASWVFDKIKNELPQQVNLKDIQPDLNPTFLSYCSLFSLAHSQILISIISDRKKMNFELQSQLSKGIYELFSSCLNLSNEGLVKYSDNFLKTFLNNRRFFYFSQGFIKMKELANEEFKSKAVGYGKMVVYLSLARDSLNAGVKDIKTIGHLVSVEEYLSFQAQLDSDIKIMLDKNRTIYFEALPDANSLPKIEKKIMANPAAFPELGVKNTDYDNLLSNLVPKEAKILIDQYKFKMMEFITENLSRFTNESKIDKFLIDLNLPGALESAITQDQISEYLWSKINEVQQKGGLVYLESNIKNIDNLRESDSKLINDINIIFFNEEAEDTKLRQFYGNRWRREPSNIINSSYLGALSQYAQKIELAKKCDGNIVATIKDNYKYFDLLGLSKSALEKRIPSKVDSQLLKEIPEAKSLKEEIQVLQELKSKNSAIIEGVFSEFNQENLIPIYLEIIRKNASEANFIKEQQDKYLGLINELDKLENEISQSQERIVQKNSVFLSIRDSKLKPKPENEQYFKDLEYYCNMYNDRLNNLLQGMNFYYSLEEKLQQLLQNANDFVTSRNIQKEELLKSISTGGQAINSNQYYDFSKQQGGNTGTTQQCKSIN